jgi:hypothetical protein
MRSSGTGTPGAGPFHLSWTEVGLVFAFLVPAALIALWARLLRRELRNDAGTKKKLQ